MNLSIPNAKSFAARWAKETSEEKFKDAFWLAFFSEVCGITDPLKAGLDFEHQVSVFEKGKITKKKIDAYFAGVFLIEHKSASVDLDVGEQQARRYLTALTPVERPPYILVSNFHRFRFIDVAMGSSRDFDTSDLDSNIGLFEEAFTQDRSRVSRNELAVTSQIASRLGDLFNWLTKDGLSSESASLFIDRLVFCFFADDTFLWRYGLFDELMRGTRDDGQGLGLVLNQLFEVLDTKEDSRPSNLEPRFRDFPYVNGGLFSERFQPIGLGREIRELLLEISTFNWSKVDTSIFGALYQSSRNKREGRRKGRHYTSEQKILDILHPLFLDDLQADLRKAWNSKLALDTFCRKLEKIKIFDPACGSGNFLIVSYREIRRLEIEALARINVLSGNDSQASLLDQEVFLRFGLENLFGIELETWSLGIAKVALVLTQAQLNFEMHSRLGSSSPSLPLPELPNMRLGNALRIEWNTVCPPSDSTFIVGNPPYKGRERDEEQSRDQEIVWQGAKGAKSTDYVANWFIKASRFMGKTKAKAAFVATNSITQGAQPAYLWPVLREQGTEITFAKQTFPWESDISGKASVHCVAIGFANQEIPTLKKLWAQKTSKNEFGLIETTKISPYLDEVDDLIVEPRPQAPLCPHLPELVGGSKPRDGGHLSNLTPQEAAEIRESDPIASKYLRRIVGAREMVQGIERFCLWLAESSPRERIDSPVLAERIENVRLDRINAGAKVDVDKASPKRDKIGSPHLFAEDHQPSVRFLAVPAVSSINRKHVPVTFFNPDTIANNRLYMIPNADLGVFGILQSRAFALWAESRGSRMKSDYQLAARTVYNTFPLRKLSATELNQLEEISNDLLSARGATNLSLNEIYDPKSMPSEVRPVQTKLDLFIFRALGINPKDPEDVQVKKLVQLNNEMSK